MNNPNMDALEFVIPSYGWISPYPFGDTPPRDVVHAEFSCDHERQRLTRLVCSNGAIQFKSQCCRCGVGFQALKVSTLTKAARDSAPPFDHELRESWREARTARTNELGPLYREARHLLWRDKYEDHMRSPEWMDKRALVLERAGGKCEDCGIRPPVHVHHNTYDRLGCEALEDLEALCLECHAARHDHMREEGVTP